MKFFFLFYLFLITFQEDLPNVISKYDSNARFIWVFSASINSEKYNESLMLLTKDPLGLDKRNTFIIELFPEGGIGPDGKPIGEDEIKLIRNHFLLKPTEFKIILMDLEHKEIYRSDKPISCKEIFDRFDSEDK